MTSPRPRRTYCSAEWSTVLRVQELRPELPVPNVLVRAQVAAAYIDLLGNDLGQRVAGHVRDDMGTDLARGPVHQRQDRGLGRALVGTVVDNAWIDDEVQIMVSSGVELARTSSSEVVTSVWPALWLTLPRLGSRVQIRSSAPEKCRSGGVKGPIPPRGIPKGGRFVHLACTYVEASARHVLPCTILGWDPLRQPHALFCVLTPLVTSSA